MSDQEKFLARWSRRKRATADMKAAEPEAASIVAETAPEGADAQAPKPNEPEPFDPAQLPPLESISAGSDLRAFLQKNVPADLTRAALRRAWTADPAIRDFVGLSENAWDFTAPDAIPGFGPLEMNDDVRKMLAEIWGEKPDVQPASPPGPPPEDIQTASAPDISAPAEMTAPSGTQGDADDEPAGQAEAQPQAEPDPPEQRADAAAQQQRPPEPEEPLRPHGHGRALPQ